MTVTHKDRIEALEAKFKTLDAGMAKIDRLEKMFENFVQKKSKKTHSESSSDGSINSDDNCSDDIRVLRIANEEERPRCGKDRWKGRPKLTCPVFNGTDPNSWLSRVQQYFDLNEVEKENWVRYAAYFLEGGVNVWWQWLTRVYQKKGKWVRWKDFAKELMNRFGPSEYTDYDEALAHIKKSGSLGDYQKKFEKLAKRVEDWPEKGLVGAFMGGLKS